MEDNTKRPHVCIINCQMEMSYLLDSGEVSGQCVNRESLKKLGVNPDFIMVIKGYDLNDCIQNVKAKLEQLNE